MSIPTLAAARMVNGGGEEQRLSFEKFPHTGAVKTYCVDAQVADSACTATAYLTGIKNNKGTIGVNANVKQENCTAELDTSTHTYSIAKWALEGGKVAGLVTTTRVTHASPAGVFAHTAHRDWEDVADLEESCPNPEIKDIAYQLIQSDLGKKLKVIMGGGRSKFLPTSATDEENQKGTRTDGLNLIDVWKGGEGVRSYAWNKEQMLAINANETDYVLGLFEGSHMLYHLEAVDKKVEDIEPTLEEMTRKAIEVLSKNENGFFLFVEGGRIDMAHHEDWARMALDETQEFSKAVAVAREMLSEEETLIVVSSDHSHVMSYSGYGSRGSDVFGIGGEDDINGLPYMVLSYANGPGYTTHVVDGHRQDVSKMDTTSREFRFPSTRPLSSETHGGDDIGVFASGPYSHLFSGVYEQHTIPHLMAYAACIGDGLTACDK